MFFSFSLNNISVYIVFSVTGIPSSICFIIMVKLVSVVLYWVPQFFIFRFPSIWFFFIDSISTFLFIFFHCLFICFLLEDLYHTHKSCFKFFFLLCLNIQGGTHMKQTSSLGNSTSYIIHISPSVLSHTSSLFLLTDLLTIYLFVSQLFHYDICS